MANLNVFRGEAFPKHYSSCAYVEQVRYAIVQLPAGKSARKLASVAESKQPLP